MSKNNKKKFCLIIISLFLFQLFLVNINIFNAFGYQTDEDLETTVNAELNSNTLELKGNSLMTTGTHTFYETPELDVGTFEHDITSIDVLNIQAPSYTTSDSDDFQITDPTFDTNETLFLNQSVGEYTCDGGLDTVISLNMDYESNDNDIIDIFNDDFSADSWSSYNMNSTSIQYSTSLDQDSTVWSYNPNSNYGTSTALTVYKGTYEYMVYVSADIPYLYESTYANSLLWLYAYQVDSACYIKVYDTSDFNEYTITWNNKPSTLYSPICVKYITSTGWNSFSLSDVYSNYVLMHDSGGASYRRFYSRESGTPPYITHYLNKFYQNTGSGYFYMQTATDQELLNAKSPVYSNTTCITAGDHIILDCQTTSSEQLLLKLWKSGEVVKAYPIFNYGNNNYSRHEVDIPVDEYTEFDQMSINGKFDDTEYFKCWDISVEEHVGKNFFSDAYVHDFSYEVLGQNYTEDFTLILDDDNSEHTTSEGTYTYYFDSSMFSNRDENDDVIIHSQAINFTLTMNIERDANLTVNASYSSNSWVVPSVVGLHINGEEVSDESTNSGYCALADFPETLTITSTSKVYFRLDITSLFSFKLDLDVISKTYLRKSFKLMSNHDINLTSIQFPETLWIKKTYLNNIDHDDDNPLTLNPAVEMATNSIFKLEVITYGDIYIPLNQDIEGGYYLVYTENFGTNTGEMYHSYLFSDYNHDYTVNGNLYMQNEFPSAYYEENWSNWNLNYNSSYTDSSFSDGTLSSNITTDSNKTPQLENFTINEGSLDEYSSKQVYPATYSFTDDTILSIPSNWTEVGPTVEVQAEKDSHGKIICFDDESGSELSGMTNAYSPQTSGTIEFWVYDTDVSKGFQIIPLAPNILFQIDDGYLQYQDSGWQNIVDISSNTWHHVRIDIECGTNNYEGLSPDTFYLYLDGAQYGPYDFYIPASSISSLSFYTILSDSSYQVFVDAVGYSWDPDYEIGENINPILANLSVIDDDYMTFNSTEKYNYPGTYSFDNLTENPFYEVPGVNCSSEISDFMDHKNVLKLIDQSLSDYIYTQITFTSEVSGTIEFWTSYNDSYGLYLWCSKSGINGINMKIDSNILYIINDSSWENVATLSSNQWYHFRFDFECTTNNYNGLDQFTYDFYLNGYYEGWFYFQYLVGLSGITTIGISTLGSASQDVYLDAISFSWDDDYKIGDNNYWRNYQGTYDFEDDTVNESPNDWTISPSNYNGYVIVEPSFGDHNKIVHLYGNDTVTNTKMSQNFGDYTNGTIELYFQTDDISKEYYIYTRYNGYTATYIRTFNSKLQIYNGVSGWTFISDLLLSDFWYHLKLFFNCSSDTTSIYINEFYLGTYNFYLNNDFDTLNTLILQCSNNVIGKSLFIDAIGYSWDDDYQVGDNLKYNMYPTINITITQQVDFDIMGDLFLYYSLNTTENFTVTISAFNFNTHKFDVINSSIYYSDFTLEMQSLNSSYFNMSNYLIFNIHGTNDNESFTEFQLFLEAFSLYVGVERDAIITKDIALGFLTDFDSSEYDAYQKIFNISMELTYRFLIDNSTFHYHASYNNTDLNTSSEWINLQYDFILNTRGAGDPDYFTLFFNISNGILEISSINYTLEFRCINLESQYQLYQYFKLSPDFSITSNDITQETIYLNYTFSFTPTSFLDFGYNNSVSNDIFLYQVYVQGESGWIHQDFGFNSTITNSPRINLTSILQDNNQTSFQEVYIKFFLSGAESSITIDTFNISISTNKLQLTKTPRTDVDSVEFQEPMQATRSYSYWYFENSYTINDVSLEDVETSGTVSTFNVNDSKYFFVKSFYSDDLILGLLDYDPNWDVSYEVLINNGTYTRMRIDYKADFIITNVTIILNLKNDGILNDNWILGTQDSYTFKLTIPGISFTSTKQSFYIEGYSTIPYAVMSSYESDQNWNRIVTDSEINYAGYLTYPKYTQVFLLTKETDWTAYSVYYGSSIYSAETMNPTLIKVLGDGFDPDVDDSYLYFRTVPFKSADFEFDGATITITINCSIDVENVYFLYTFDPSGVHSLALQSSNNSISIQDLTDSGDVDGHLYFATVKIYSGITQIKISVNFATPIEMVVQSIIIFVILGIAVIGYYYLKRNEEKVEKLSKKISKNLKEKLSRKKKEKGVKEISLSIKDNKIYLEDKR